MLNFKRVPAGWSHQKERGYEWDLTADKESPQPLGVYVKGFDAQVRSTIQEAFKI